MKTSNVIQKWAGGGYSRLRSYECKAPGNRKKLFFIAYTILFLIMVCLVYSYFFLNGKSFIWREDGWKQHFKALVYYAKWMRSIISNFIETHTLSIPTFSFSIGYGADLLTTLQYYVIGDPLNLLAVFVPTRYMVHFYDFSILLHLYLAGLAFSAYCFYMGKTSRAGVLAGAFTYIFCGFSLFTSVRHLFFSNPMIYFPFLLLGVEKVLKEKKPWVLTGAVFVSAISNFYFFYMLVLLTVLYVILRMFQLYRKNEWKKAAVTVLKIGGYSAVGVMLSAVLFLPVVLLFLGDQRSGSGYTCNLFYSVDYYEKLFSNFISYYGTGSIVKLGYSAVSLLAVFLLYVTPKKNRGLKIAFCVLTVFLLLPFFGHVFNGFSYAVNRWIWGYSMLVAYILASMWPELISMSRKNSVKLLVLAGIYALLALRTRPGTTAGMGCSLAVLLFALAVIILFSQEAGKIRLQCTILGLVLLDICGHAYFAYDMHQGDYIEQFKNVDDVNSELVNTEARAVEALGDEDGFYRYSGESITQNSTLLSGLSGVDYFWSLSNGAITSFMKETGIQFFTSAYYLRLDSRAVMNTLAAVKYYVNSMDESERTSVPYGFSEIELKDEKLAAQYRMYENDYVLPLGYTCSNYISKEKYEEMDAVERQEAMLQGVFLEEEPEGYQELTPVLTGQKVDYVVNCDSQAVTAQGNSFVTTGKNATVTLTFEGLENCETYLYVRGMDYKGVSPLDLYNDDTSIDPLNLYTAEKWNKLQKYSQNKKIYEDHYWEEPDSAKWYLKATDTAGTVTSNLFMYKTPRYKWYGGQHDFLTNLGYGEAAKNSVTITLEEIGTYSFDSLEIICQPMNAYGSQVMALKENVLENADIHKDPASNATSEVTGTISLKEPKILCLSIPYSSGWRAYVDEQEEKLLQANTMYMALPLDAGEHEIRLVYRTPGLLAGGGITCAGIICLFGIVLFHKKKVQKTKAFCQDEN